MGLWCGAAEIGAERKMGRITERDRVKTILKLSIALGVLLGTAALQAQGAAAVGDWAVHAACEREIRWCHPIRLRRFEDPILHKPGAWEALHTFNPAAIVRNGKVYVLYRAEDNSGTMDIGGHTSRLGLAESDDGIHFKRMGEPVFYPAEDDQQAREWPGGVEDPRIVERDDGTYVLTYTQWNRKTYSVGIATSRDLKHWTKYGPAFLTALGGKYANLMYKSAGIVTQLKDGRLIAAKIAGRYWMYWGEGSIKLATSDDAIHWIPVEDMHGKLVELLRPRPGHFDSTFPETGPPPVLTSAGIVVLYNGKNATEERRRSFTRTQCVRGGRGALRRVESGKPADADRQAGAEAGIAV